MAARDWELRRWTTAVNVELWAAPRQSRGISYVSLVGGRVVRFLVSAIAAAFEPRVRLIAENLCLRQQLLVLQRRYPRPRLGNADRRFWIIASRWFSSWRGLLLIVKPETVLRWYRRGWRAYWSRRSRRQPPRSGRRPIP